MDAVRLAAHGGWRAAARGSGLLSTAPDGTERVAPTIFAEMSALASRTGAINLGQGFPDTDGPAWIAKAAIEQYIPSELIEPVAEVLRLVMQLRVENE